MISLTQNYLPQSEIVVNESPQGLLRHHQLLYVLPLDYLCADNNRSLNLSRKSKFLAAALAESSVAAQRVVTIRVKDE